LQQLLAQSLSNFELLLAIEAAEFNLQYADVLHPSRLRIVAQQLNLLRNYCITLLTLKNEIVARLQQPLAGPSIIMKREHQQALEQVVLQVLTTSPPVSAYGQLIISPQACKMIASVSAHIDSLQLLRRAPLTPAPYLQQLQRFQSECAALQQLLHTARASSSSMHGLLDQTNSDRQHYA
jgi:hypothetical protein